jgi:hypothetical protein
VNKKRAAGIEPPAEGIQRGRLWALRNSSDEPLFQSFETGLPTLFVTRKQAELWQRRINAECGGHVEVVEVKIIEAAKR